MDEEKKMPETEEAEESNESSEVIEDQMDIGERDADVYSEEGREKLEEEGEISPAEEGFMEGAEGVGEDAICKQCGKILSNDEKEGIVAKEINGKRELFCCQEHADVYEKNNTQ